MMSNLIILLLIILVFLIFRRKRRVNKVVNHSDYHAFVEQDDPIKEMYEKDQELPTMQDTVYSDDLENYGIDDIKMIASDRRRMPVNSFHD